MRFVFNLRKGLGVSFAKAQGGKTVFGCHFLKSCLFVLKTRFFSWLRFAVEIVNLKIFFVQEQVQEVMLTLEDW